MSDPIYTVKNGRIYRENAIQHETEIEVTLNYYDRRQVKLNLIQLPGAIKHDDRIFIHRVRNSKSPPYYDELVITEAEKIDANAIRKGLEQAKTQKEVNHV